MADSEVNPPGQATGESAKAGPAKNPSALDAAIDAALQVLQRLYDERPGLLLAMVRVLDDPPEVGEMIVRFRDKRLSGLEMRESWF